MKGTDYINIIAIILFIFLIPINIKQQKQIRTEQIKRNYDLVVEIATEDAINVMLEPEDSLSLEELSEGYSANIKRFKVNIDKALERFYKTMYINMNIENDEVAQEAFKMYVPLKIIVSYDGYYINTWYDTNNGTKEVWLPKRAYTYYDNSNDLIINYTLDDYLYVYNINTAAWDEGKREDIWLKYHLSIFDISNFDSFRRQIVVEHINKDFQYFINKNNQIASKYGFSYDLNIPSIDSEIWNNSIDGITFMAFLQGLHINGLDTFYSTYGFSGTEIIKSKKYYGNTINAVKYYHREGCSNTIGNEVIFDSKVEAAKEGYTPCLECINKIN